MSKLKKNSLALVFVICLLCVFLCGSALAEETDNGVSYTETPVYVDGLLSCRGYMIGDESYVSLEAACAVLGYNADVNYDKEINKLTVEVAGITIEAGFEDEYLTVAELNGFEAALPVKFVPLQKEINAFRASKEDWELARMRKAQEITDRAFTEVCTRIHTGMTEKELEAELIYCLYKNGAEGLSFDPIVVSGPNTSMPHGVAGSRVLQDGDFVTMDFGVLYQGYCSDMTRTVALGHATEEMRKVYDTVLRAQLAGIAASHAGASGKSVDGAARDIITEAGYGPYFGHSYGHSLGLEIHEAPNCTPRNENPIPAGAVCSAEPGIYIPGKFGVRIEDVVIFREGGCEVITHSPKELTIL